MVVEGERKRPGWGGHKGVLQARMAEDYSLSIEFAAKDGDIGYF